MLPAALPLSAPQAERWLRAGLPRWVTSVALPACWAIAFLTAAITDTTRCTPQDPSACGPDSTFAFAFVVLLATPVLLWWMPLLGCLAGVAFALADLRYDDVTGARWAFGLHGLLCALVAVRLVRGAAEQRRIAALVSGGLPVDAGRFAALPDDGGSRRRLAVAGLLVLAGLGFFGWYGHDVSGERAHLHRAVAAPARIVAVRPDESVTVEVRTPSAGTRQYTIGVYDYTGPYPPHSSTPVLLDPRDPGWIRLVAEPRDVTYWQSAGAGCLLLALLWLLHGWRRQRDLAALHSSPRAMVRVRICSEDEAHALILPAADGSGRWAERPIARLAVFEASEPADEDPTAGDEAWDDEAWDDAAWDYQAQAEFGRAWRDEDPTGRQRFDPPPAQVEDAVLIGDLRDGGVAMLITADAVLLPDGRLRTGRAGGGQRTGRAGGGQPPPPGEHPTPRRAPWTWLSRRTEPVEDELFPGAAVDPASLRQPLPLPITARPGIRHRAAGLLMVLGGLAGYPLTVQLLRPHLVGLVSLAWLGSTPVRFGAARLFGYLRLDHHRFEVTGHWRTHSVPWDRLHGVRRHGQAVSIAWEPDVVIAAGPFDDPTGELRPPDWTEQLGAMMLLQRQRALLGGLPGRRINTRPGLALAVLAAYSVVVLISVWRWW